MADTPSSYMVGSMVRLTCSFTSLGSPVDPTEITVKVKNPAGQTSTYLYSLTQVTKLGPGVYSKDVSADSSGEWNYRFAATGTIVAAAEGKFNVQTSRVI